MKLPLNDKIAARHSRTSLIAFVTLALAASLHLFMEVPLFPSTPPTFSVTLDANSVSAVYFKTTATKCSLQSVELLQAKDQLHAQSNEDRVLLQYFNGFCGGTYAEMGALTGVPYSNSHVFNKAFGWKGLLVELVPVVFEKLLNNRQDELAVVNAAVCYEPRLLHFIGEDAVAGIWEFMDPQFKAQWHAGKTFKDTTEITCQPLQAIIDENIVAVHDEYKSGVVYFDFGSLGIEGAELEALKSIDWSRTGFGVILVEDGPGLKNTIIRTFLERKGYIFVKHEVQSLWFINPRFDEIYADFLH